MKNILISSTFIFLSVTIYAQEKEPENSVSIIEVAVQEEAPNPDEGYFIVEENAMFQGGDIYSFVNWVNQNLKYPVDADVSGRIFLEFSVDTLGTVADIKLLRGIDPKLDEEAIRVVKSSPKWTPAKQNGVKVKQKITIPVSFTLQ